MNHVILEFYLRLRLITGTTELDEQLKRLPRMRKFRSSNPGPGSILHRLQTVRLLYSIYPSSCIALAL